MEIEIAGDGYQRIVLLVVLLLCLIAGVGVLGTFVTPVEAGEPVLLSPDRWQAATLARKARGETRVLHRDAERLLALLNEGAPDPVSAMLLAQGIYARHRTGTSATATARQTLIIAAELAARYAAGSVPLVDALIAAEEALHRLDPLLEQPEATTPSSAANHEPAVQGQAHFLFLPLVLKGHSWT
ncbi:MAG: hypothetical protein H3C34_25830 [Caldilineaceae bacterium]|nr:hypothetical protein [Caldilineaceae bacterium]